MLWIIYLSISLICLVSTRAEDKHKYAVVVDAGSTGSRVFVYRFTALSDGSTTVRTTTGGKVRPGLSSFVDKTTDIGPYLIPLLINAAELIPKEFYDSTEFYIKGTAGMRLLPISSQQQIWDAAFSYLTNGTECNVTLSYQRENFGTISGHDEAFYAVIASNYIAGRVDTDLR